MLSTTSRPNARKFSSWFENKSVAEIANEMQLSTRTVEKQIGIALKKLRVDLADYLSVAYLIYLLYP